MIRPTGRRLSSRRFTNSTRSCRPNLARIREKLTDFKPRGMLGFIRVEGDLPGGGVLTIKGFVTAVRRRYRQRMRATGCWRLSSSIGCALALAACGSMAGLVGGPSTGAADPQPSAAVLTPSTRIEPSRAVAVVPTGRIPETRLPSVVVRGPDLSAAAPVPQHAGATAGKSGDVTLNFAGADIRDVVGQVLGETL